MSTQKTYETMQVNWLSESDEIMRIREKVFITEQRFGKETLIDHLDSDSFHLLVKDTKGRSVACGRLNQNGRIGRIAVMIDHRGFGIGTMILNKLIEIAEESKIRTLTLNTETELTHFYDQQKFHVDGPVYMKQGVPFQRMRMRLG
jgi:predicted GNAT family N-acyltransferase